MTQTASNGTANGTATGPDRRIGYFQYYQDGDFGVLWLDVSQTDGYGCVFNRAGVQGNTVRGKSARDNNGQIEDLRSDCTATLGASSAQVSPPAPPPVQTQPAPPPPSPSSAVTLTWPPTLATGQQYSVSITNLATWNVSLTGQSGTNFTGAATPTGGAGTALQASFFYRADVDTAELDLTDGTQLYACLFTGRASIQNGALRGQAFYRGTPQGAFSNLNATCEVRPIASGLGVQPIGPAPAPTSPTPVPPAPPPSSPALSWPPAFAVGQSWSATFQAGTWGVTFTERDSDGDPRGATTSGPDRRTAGAYLSDSGAAIFYVGNSNEGLFCVVQRSGLSGNTLSGQAQRVSPPGAQQSQPAGPCSFTLQGGAPAGNAQPGPSSPGTTGTTPMTSNPVSTNPASSGAALSWPPTFAVGQTWNVNFQSAAWSVTFTERDSDGDPRGITTSGPDRRTAGGFMLSPTEATLYTVNNTEVLRCVAVRSGLSGQTLTGQAQRISPPRNDSPIQAAGPCTFTLQGSTGTTSSTPSTGTSGTSGVGTSSAALSWPPAFAVGQTWSATFQMGTWTVRFTELDNDGDPRGLTTAGPDHRVIGAFMNNGAAVLLMASTTEIYYCIAERNGLNGSTLSGQARRFSPPNAQQGSAAGACSFSLQPQTLSVAKLSGLEAWLTVPALEGSKIVKFGR